MSVGLEKRRGTGTVKKIVVPLLLAAWLGGCAPWKPFHRIHLGMPKDKVIETLGTPSEASGAGKEEYLWYVPLNKFWKRYYVRLVNGRVEAYGPVGEDGEKP